MDLTNLYSVSATEAVRLIRDGVISSEQFVDACLARIAEVDGKFKPGHFSILIMLFSKRARRTSDA